MRLKKWLKITENSEKCQKLQTGCNATLEWLRGILFLYTLRWYDNKKREVLKYGKTKEKKTA